MLHKQRGGMQRWNRCGIKKGTRITLLKRGRDPELEKQILEAYCSSVPRELRLNGKRIGHQRLLRGQMAVIKLPAMGEFLGGQMGVPVGGGLCHLRFLDRAIPWHHMTVPPQNGFVFDAAIEYTGELNTDLIKQLCLFAARLYDWLCTEFESTSLENKKRIEELMFLHCRLTGEETFLNRFSVFKVYNSNESFNLVQIRQKSRDGVLYGVPAKKERSRYHTGSKHVLYLTREQADLLINHLNIPIVFLDPIGGSSNGFGVFIYKMKKKIKRMFLKCLGEPKKVLDPGELSKPEQMLIMGLIRHKVGYRVFMIESKGPFASIEGKNKRIYIRRNHGVVRKGVEGVEEDPRNVEIFIPLILT